jgi:hypothetical protein
MRVGLNNLRAVHVSPINLWMIEPVFMKPGTYRVSQEESARLREGVPYAKRYRYNPKHLYSKLNGHGDNGQRSLKLWQVLITKYILKLAVICGFCNVNNVRNIRLTCEWRDAIMVWYGIFRGGFPHALRPLCGPLYIPCEFSTQPPYPLSSSAMHGLPAEEQWYPAIAPFCF